MQRIGFIGGGKMAGAMVGALVRSGTAQAGQVVVSDISEACRQGLREAYGVQVTPDNLAVVDGADVLVLAVKPQQLDDVLAGIAAYVGAGQLVVSIAAGKRLAHLESRLPAGRLVRVMPNLAALVGASMSVYCLGGRCVAADRETMARLLSAFGAARELPEAQFDAVTALSGSGPAFVAYYVAAMIKGGEALGLAAADAAALATQTALGTAQLLAAGMYTPEGLIQSVSSARGTTVAGLEVLTRTALVDDVLRTLAAAAARSRELSQ